MPMRMGRIVLIAIAVEAMAILVLVLLVALLGPSEPDAAYAYAERLGFWVGPTAGFLLCIAGGWLAARKLTAHHARTGLIVGAVVAVIDVALLVASRAEFHPVFALSGIGKLVAGSLGGWLAGRSTPSRN